MENWRLNGWPERYLFQVALGAETGSVHLADVDCPRTTVSVSEKSRKERSVKVPLAPLDDFRHHWQDRPVGSLKIYVEGYEEEVFCGSDALLRQDRPRLIMFESLKGALDKEIQKFLEEHAYIIFQLDEQGRPDSSRASNQNLFAVPAELSSPLLEKQVTIQR